MRPGVPPCLFIDEERSICIHFQFPNPLSGTAEKAVDRAPGSQSTKITPPRLLRGLSTHFKAGFPHLPLGWRNYSQCHTSSAQQLATDPGAPLDTQQSTRCLTVSHKFWSTGSLHLVLEDHRTDIKCSSANTCTLR